MSCLLAARRHMGPFSPWLGASRQNESEGNVNTTHRAYDEAAGDFKRLFLFMAYLGEYGRSHTTWCVGRLADWKYALHENKTAAPAFCERNAELWFDGLGELVAFALSEEGDADFTIVTLPGARFLFEPILEWVRAHWDERGPLKIELTERQAAEAAILSRHGFRHEAPFAARRYDLGGALPLPVELPEGFRIVDMATHPDWRGLRLLRHNAFGGGGPVSEEVLAHQLAFYLNTHAGPVYHAPTDLCVMAPDGRLVAGCEALIDTRNNWADVERVCTHNDYRRRGFARAVIVECFHRLRAMGLHAAFITGYSEAAMSLYGSLGDGIELIRHIYTRGARY